MPTACLKIFTVIYIQRLWQDDGFRWGEVEDRKKSDPSLLADDKDQFAFNGASKKI